MVWAETAVPAYLRYDRALYDWVRGLARDAGVPIYLGFPDAAREADGVFRKYNSSGLISAYGVLLEQYAKLAELDTDTIPPTAQTIELENILREDVARPSLPPEAVLRNAPERDGDFFVVPAILGGGGQPDLLPPNHGRRPGPAVNGRLPGHAVGFTPVHGQVARRRMAIATRATELGPFPGRRRGPGGAGETEGEDKPGGGRRKGQHGEAVADGLGRR